MNRPGIPLTNKQESLIRLGRVMLCHEWVHDYSHSNLPSLRCFNKLEIPPESASGKCFLKCDQHGFIDWASATPEDDSLYNAHHFPDKNHSG